jgi:hypothetical protein
MSIAAALRFPGGKRFAFTIFDDCDNSTVANTRPFYALLERLGMRTTKTVWSLNSADVHPNWRGSSTLEDPEYRAFAQELQSRGFEVASHGASMMSSPRDRIRRALDTFREAFGHYPRCHANHGSNRDNLYWFQDRFRSRLLRVLYACRLAGKTHRSEGHVPGSPYFWGDLCREHIAYVRAFTFPVTNVLSVHRNVLYRDPETEFVNFWFSASHAGNVHAFNRLLQPDRQAALARGGVSIVATHGAAGFVRNGEVNAETRRLLELLAEKDGWFVPVSTLLDSLRLQGLGQPIPLVERRLLELRWLCHALRRGVGR